MIFTLPSPEADAPTKEAPAAEEPEAEEPETVETEADEDDLDALLASLEDDDDDSDAGDDEEELDPELAGVAVKRCVRGIRQLRKRSTGAIENRVVTKGRKITSTGITR